MKKILTTMFAVLLLAVFIAVLPICADAAAKATITKQPTSAKVYVGKKISVSVKATGDGLKYKWYYKDTDMSAYKVDTAMKTATYSRKMTKDMDGRQIYCKITDKYGKVLKTTTVKLTAKNKATITKQPVSAKVSVGTKATISVKATGDGLKYKWYYKDPNMKTFVVDSAMKTAAYNRKMTKDMNGRQVYCKITDKYGNTVKSAVVKLTAKITITKQPASAKVYVGSKVPVSVKATGVSLKYQWYYKDTKMTAYKLDSSITGATYNRKMTKAMDGRRIYCKITDKYGNTVKTATVKLTARNKVTLTKQLVSKQVYAGQKATLSVGATGDGLTYVWYHKSATAKKFTVASSTTAKYSLSMTAARSGRQVYCKITDKYGNTVTTKTVTLTTMNRATITTQPQSAKAHSGDQIKLTLKATGDGITYTWYEKKPSSNQFVKTGNFTGNTYIVSMSASVNGRQVYCVVQDKYGNQAVSKTVTLSLAKKIQVIMPPRDTKVNLGSKVTVSVKADGEGLSYLWYLKKPADSVFTKTNVKTNTYSCVMTEALNGSRVYCQITDRYGKQVRSTAATLYAPTPAAIVKQPAAVVQVMADTQVTVQFTASGDGLKYQWYYKDVGDTGFTASDSKTNKYTLNMDAQFDGRQIYCQVTDQYGNKVRTRTVTLEQLPFRSAIYANRVPCVELVGKHFDTTDQVEWIFNEVGKDESNNIYGIATEIVKKANVPIQNMYFGDGTYLTKYLNATEEDVQTLLDGLKYIGYEIHSTSTLNDEVTAINLTYGAYCCTLTYSKLTKEIYLTASETMKYSPLLKQENASTKAPVINGAETKLTMLPTEKGGDCYIIQLKNGNFIIFDGDSANTLPDILNYLEANTPVGKTPVVEAWFITHGHYDHCGWANGFVTDTTAADRVRVEGVYFNQTAEQNWKQTVYAWREDTAQTGWRTLTGNPWPARVKPGVAKMKTSAGTQTPMYRPQTGQIYYFNGLQVEIAYTQEQICFADYQMDLNASSTWYLVRSEEGNTFLDAGDTENVNMEKVITMYSNTYDIYNGNLDVMSLFHHGHNLYVQFKDIFRAPIMLLPSNGTRTWNAQATTVYHYYTKTFYTDRVENEFKTDGLGQKVYDYGEGTWVYNFATGQITK